MELVRYIHLNPVRSKLLSNVAGYPCSGDLAYRIGKPTAIIDPRPVLRMIGGGAGYRKFVQDGLREGHKEEYYEVEDQRFLGKGEFGEQLRREFDREERPKKKRPLAEVISNLARALKIAPGILRVKSRVWAVSRQRTIIGYVLVRRGGYRVKEVTGYIGRDPTTLSSLLSR